MALPAGADLTRVGVALAITRTHEPPGLRLDGEIDLSNVATVEGLLETWPDPESIHLDVSGLSFCDVAGVRLFVAHAQKRRVVLHRISAQIEKVLVLAGWNEVPGLGFCNCEMRD